MGIGQPTADFSTAEKFGDKIKDADAEKAREFIQSVSSGQYINEAEHGAEAALTTLLGRMAASSGKGVTWDDMLRSEEVLDPKIDLNQFA